MDDATLDAIAILKTAMDKVDCRDLSGFRCGACILLNALESLDPAGITLDWEPASVHPSRPIRMA